MDNEYKGSKNASEGSKLDAKSDQAMQRPKTLSEGGKQQSSEHTMNDEDTGSKSAPEGSNQPAGSDVDLENRTPSSQDSKQEDEKDQSQTKPKSAPPSLHKKLDTYLKATKPGRGLSTLKKKLGKAKSKMKKNLLHKSLQNKGMGSQNKHDEEQEKFAEKMAEGAHDPMSLLMALLVMILSELEHTTKKATTKIEKLDKNLDKLQKDMDKLDKKMDKYERATKPEVKKALAKEIKGDKAKLDAKSKKLQKSHQASGSGVTEVSILNTLKKLRPDRQKKYNKAISQSELLNDRYNQFSKDQKQEKQQVEAKDQKPEPTEAGQKGADQDPAVTEAAEKEASEEYQQEDDAELREAKRGDGDADPDEDPDADRSAGTKKESSGKSSDEDSDQDDTQDDTQDEDPDAGRSGKDQERADRTNNEERKDSANKPGQDTQKASDDASPSMSMRQEQMKNASGALAKDMDTNEKPGISPQKQYKPSSDKGSGG